MRINPLVLLPGDNTHFGVVASVVSTRHNTNIKVTFEDGSKRTFRKFDEVEVL